MDHSIVPIMFGKRFSEWSEHQEVRDAGFRDASEHSCPLLFVGDDFSKTDLERA